jgi:CRISPR system Cascade subunit CasE
LYAIDRIGAQWQLEIQALAYADVTSLPAGYALPPIRQRDDLDAQLAQLQTQAVYRFRLTANVTKKSIHIARRVSLTDRADQIDWLVRKAETAGFTVNQSDLSITPEPLIMGTHPNGTLRYDAVRFAGTLTVTDSALVRQTVVSGIGAAKAYGCGLLRIGAAVHPST